MSTSTRIAMILIMSCLGRTTEAGLITLFYHDESDDVTPTIGLTTKDLPDDIKITGTDAPFEEEDFDVSISNFFARVPAAGSSIVNLLEVGESTSPHLFSDDVVFSWDGNSTALKIHFGSADFTDPQGVGDPEISPYNVIPIPAFPVDTRASLDVKVASVETPEPATAIVLATGVPIILGIGWRRNRGRR